MYAGYYSEAYTRANGISIMGEPVRNADSQASSYTHRIRLHFTKIPGTDGRTDGHIHTHNSEKHRSRLHMRITGTMRGEGAQRWVRNWENEIRNKMNNKLWTRK